MVKAQLLSGISQLLCQSDIDPENFYDLFGLNPSIENEPSQLIPFKMFVEILETLRQQTSFNHPSVNLAKIQLQRAPEPYFDLVKSAPNIDVALQVAKRFRYIYGEITFWHWTIESEYVLIQRQSFTPLDIRDSEFCFYSLAIVCLLAKSIVGRQLRFKRISLIQPEDENKIELETFFGCPISFSQDFDGFILDINDLFKPNNNFDPKRYEKLLKELSVHPIVFPENQQFSTLVKSLILQMLSTGKYTLNVIANIMNIHPRTIQNRLLKEGFSYAELLNEVRMNGAKRLLIQKEIPLTQISLMLGYSEASAFSRAFKTAYKCSPRTWRNKYCAD
jgi:AraC-like DNA-binding protein